MVNDAYKLELQELLIIPTKIVTMLHRMLLVVQYSTTPFIYKVSILVL